MYVTRPRSLYKKDPTALSVAPEGPNSGYLVIQDEEAQTYSVFGLWKNRSISHLPLPQDKDLTITYATNNGAQQDKVLFIPVLNQPLSSNRYYVIRRNGKHQGEASTCSKEDDMGTCFCCNYIKDVKPRALDSFNEYQQFEIHKKNYSGFYAKSVTPDGFPPLFLRRKTWSLSASTPHNYHLDEALGLNSSLRDQLPPFNFPLSNDHSESMVIGKWYCPFMFVKEGEKVKDQMKRSVFYEMTLEQRWEKIFSKKNNGIESELRNAVFVDVGVETELAMVGGKEAVWDEENVVDGMVWFNGLDSVGLSLAIVDRMKWEQERGGWLGGNQRQVRLRREEKFEGTKRWVNFGCYVLVESFVLKRMDGTLVLTYDFRHTHQVMCKWE